jgi:hypothetical protein
MVVTVSMILRRICQIISIQAGYNLNPLQLAFAYEDLQWKSL